MEDVGERNEKERERRLRAKLKGSEEEGGGWERLRRDQRRRGVPAGTVAACSAVRYTCTSATAAILHRVGAVVSSLGNLRSDLSLQVPPPSRPVPSRPVPLPPTTAANEFRSSPRRHVSNPNLNQPNLGVTSSSPRSLHSLSRAPHARARATVLSYPELPLPDPQHPTTTATTAPTSVHFVSR